MGLFDLPKLDPAEVARFYALERVATVWFWGRALRGLGAPKLACLECANAQVTLYDASRIAVFQVTASAIAVRAYADALRLDVAKRRYHLAAVDAMAVRRRGKPASYLAYMDHFQTLDRVPGFGTFNENFGIKGTPARKGAWVELWKSLLLRRGATEL